MKKLIIAAILTCLALDVRAQVQQQIDSTPTPSSAWIPVSVPFTMYGGMSFIRPNFGWASSDTGLFNSTNAGTTWIPIGPQRIGDTAYGNIYFYDTLHGLAWGGYERWMKNRLFLL
jgi:hypothetical protein